MKTANTIIKVITAVAAITGAIYILATYGEKMVEWARNVLGLNTAAPVEEAAEETAPAQEEPAPAEEAAETAEAPAAEEAPAEEALPEEAPDASADIPVADESDFEG